MSTDQEEPKVDYLSEDVAVNGQAYCCVSFVEPSPDRLAHKESYIMDKFLSQYTQILYLQFCKRHELQADAEFAWDNTELYDRYIDFKAIKYEDLKKEYSATIKNETHERVFKVRGSYHDLVSANKKGKQLQKSDPNFNVFTVPVGMWGPFNPVNINDIDPEYMEEQMQTLVKTHLEQEDHKTQVFKERKIAMMKNVKLDHSKPDAMKVLENSDESKRLPLRKKKTNVLHPDVKAKLQKQLKERKAGVSLEFSDDEDTTGKIERVPDEEVTDADFGEAGPAVPEVEEEVVETPAVPEVVENVAVLSVED
jgi:hypothetical protein